MAGFSLEAGAKKNELRLLRVDRARQSAIVLATREKDGRLEPAEVPLKQDQDLVERRAYDLIMRDKETLLSLDEPRAFIFAHSVLREGWDNPNVFQICSLNEARAETRKRQEIGRGLRLPVDQEGNRILDGGTNILTVVAAESYASFARSRPRPSFSRLQFVKGEGGKIVCGAKYFRAIGLDYRAVQDNTLDWMEPSSREYRMGE